MSQPPPLVVVGARGWFGRTLVHEYLSKYGAQSVGLLRLFGSREATLSLAGEWQGLELPVRALDDLCPTDLDDALALHWYAFLLPHELRVRSRVEYHRINAEIAGKVEGVLAEADGIACVFASSGAVLRPDVGPAHDDPYVQLKRQCEERVRELVPTCTLFPYAMTGRYLGAADTYALGSFIQQARSNGRIRVAAPMPVVRSYGPVEDLARLLLEAEMRGRWPDRIVPVTHTLTLDQLAMEVLAALGLPPNVEWATGEGPVEVYASVEHTFGAQLRSLGLAPATLADQIRVTASGPAFS